MNTYDSNAKRLAARAGGALGAACLALLLAVSASNPTLAQHPPQEPQCGKGNGKGADISTCTDEILNEQARTLGLLEEMSQEMGAMGLLQADEMDAATRQLGFMRKSQNRGRREKDDATDKEFDDLVVKGTPSECTFRLRPRFRMGPPPGPICTDEEIAANQCEEVCEFSAGEKTRNDQRGLRLEEDLADVLEQTKMANDELANGMDSLAALSLQILSADDDSCAFDSPHPNFEPIGPGVVLALSVTAAVLGEVSAIGQDTCRQATPVGNLSLACLVLTTVAEITKAELAWISTLNGNFTSAKVDATFECAKALKADSDDQGAQLDALEGKVDALKDDVTEVKAMLDEVMTLLSTPQGLRSGFPTR